MKAKVIAIGKESEHYSDRRKYEGKVGIFSLDPWEDLDKKKFLAAESKDFPEGEGFFYCCDIQLKEIRPKAVTSKRRK